MLAEFPSPHLFKQSREPSSLAREVLERGVGESFWTRWIVRKLVCKSEHIKTRVCIFPIYSAGLNLESTLTWSSKRIFSRATSFIPT